MPALPSVPQVLKAQFIHSYGANIPAWVHAYFRYTGSPPSVTDANNIATSLNAAWGTNFQALAGTNVQLLQVLVTDLSSATAAQGSNTAPRTGTRPGGPLTANDCALVDLKIARRYRGGKPRQYWPFGTDSDVATPQLWTSAFKSAFDAAQVNFLVAAFAITWAGGNIAQAVNVSYYQGFTVITNPQTHRARNVPTLRPTPVVDVVTNTVTNLRIATQRRRQHFSA